VAEAGPLVFLEALASGCFPLGTYFAGMGASIDAVAKALPAEAAALMKVSSDERHTVKDIRKNCVAALDLEGRDQQTLRQVAIKNYDWEVVAQKLLKNLKSL
jgi:hypothetical protein